MENTNYNLGQELAFKFYGLKKEAGAKEWLIGQPGTFMKQLGTGGLNKPGGLMHNWWKPQGMLDWGFNVGMPAYGMYNALKNKQDPNRMSNALSIAGGALGGLAGFKGFGMLGSLGGSMLGSSLGATAGKILKPLAPPRQDLPNPAFY